MATHIYRLGSLVRYHDRHRNTLRTIPLGTFNYEQKIQSLSITLMYSVLLQHKRIQNDQSATIFIPNGLKSRHISTASTPN